MFLRREVDFGSGSMPYITASSMNNGVVSYIDASNLPVDEGNCLLIGGKTLLYFHINVKTLYLMIAI